MAYSFPISYALSSSVLLAKKSTDTVRSKKKFSLTKAQNDAFTAIGKRVLKSLGLSDLAKTYKNPDKDPDIPFLWRAIEWAKESGVIALAMHPRLFMRTIGIGLQAWQSLLKSVEITGILNGADLRSTVVWEGISVPFGIVFARNQKPNPEHRFYFASPIWEPEANDQGRFRIDYGSSHLLNVSHIEKQPWLLKTLSLGTWLDVEIVEKLLNNKQSLNVFWSKWNRKGDKTGKGYDISPGSVQKSADHLLHLPDMPPRLKIFEIPYIDLPTFFERHGRRTASWPRSKALYQPPVTVISQAPGEDTHSPKAHLATQAIAFSQSYYVYSCTDHPEAETLAEFIYLLAHSTLSRYFPLMISASWGVDRMRFIKDDFDTLPFPMELAFFSANKAKIHDLATRLQYDIQKPWSELNTFIFKTYGLDKEAAQVIEDTLFSAVPYRKSGIAALNRTMKIERAPFIKRLTKELEPYFDVCGEHVEVKESGFQSDTWREPWFFLTVSRQTETVSVNPLLIQKAMEKANEDGCSRILINAPKKQGLLLGLLNQRRWWTVSRARLCAQHIIHNHINAFGLPE